MANQTRRRFLENTMLATATATAGGLMGQPILQAAKANKSANETVRVAVLGVNGRGRSHINGFTGVENCDVVAVCDPDETVGHIKGVENVHKKTGKKPTYYQDLRRVMDDDSIDVVSIATPNHWHSLAAIWAMQAGKDVYVEKPVSHNIREGRVMVDVARKEGRVCQAGTQIRSNPGVIEGIKFLKEGGLGELQVARALCYKRRKSIDHVGETPVPKGVDYDLWLGPTPLRADVPRKSLHYDWHWQWEYGNGDLGNQGIHQMDVARWGIGADTLADSVISFGGRFGYVDDGETPNTEMSIMEYGDKLLVFETRGLPTKHYLGGDAGGNDVGNIFHCENGYMKCSYTSAVVFDPDGNEIKRFSEGDDSYHYNNFVDAVRSRRVEDLNGEINEGHLSSALCHLANISYRLGESSDFGAAPAGLAGNEFAVDVFERTKSHLKDNNVDPSQVKFAMGPKLMVDKKTESFIDNAAANALTTREYRKGYEVPAQA
ncbi:Alpha-N-acetylgalactosaminidase [Symmachiella dynata]|uniref:Alpha-N-acetylgalactosaminidase n=1 Tax=Symmachiella dynata TaxID=2527995 RepID=A0A517ZS34_9PLAN|nr:Gfo/Idh/MocA family oxidoreductase [Symmachiella dynata]QDU45306.1 Alpha-N-acetylgalactosaminidase [Symmachiella dynata]